MRKKTVFNLRFFYQLVGRKGSKVERFKGLKVIRS
jgi:hypothetical protein